MSKGSVMFVLVVFVSIFLLIPLGFFIFSKDTNSADVKGAKISNVQSTFSGIRVEIASSGTWDLYQYLCVDREECIEGLDSGTAWGKVSGGSVKNYAVEIKSDYKWKNYSYLKLYVRSGWGSTSGLFNIISVDSALNAVSENIIYKGVQYSVLLIPIEGVLDNFGGSVSFSDL